MKRTWWLSCLACASLLSTPVQAQVPPDPVASKIRVAPQVQEAVFDLARRTAIHCGMAELEKNPGKRSHFSHKRGALLWDFFPDQVRIITIDVGRCKVINLEDRDSVHHAMNSQRHGDRYIITRKEEAIAIVAKLNREVGELEGDWRVTEAQLNEPPPEYSKFACPQWQVRMNRWVDGYRCSDDQVYAAINPYDGSIEQWFGPDEVDYLEPAAPLHSPEEAREVLRNVYGSDFRPVGPFWLPVAPKSALYRVAYMAFFTNADGTVQSDHVPVVDATTGETWVIPQRVLVSDGQHATRSQKDAITPYASPRIALVTQLLTNASSEDKALAKSILTLRQQQGVEPPNSKHKVYTINGHGYSFETGVGYLYWQQKSAHEEDTSWCRINLKSSDRQSLQHWFDDQSALPLH